MAKRNLNVTWHLTAVNKRGQEHTWEPSRIKYFKTCVTMSWSAGAFQSSLVELSTFHLHSVQRKSLMRYRLYNHPRIQMSNVCFIRSLMETVHVQNEQVQVLGEHGPVELKLLQSGFIIGVWKRDESVAFIMFSLHFNNIKSSEESSSGDHLLLKPPFDDVDPEYGLHGYRLHLVLHDTSKELMSETFYKLFCHRGEISDGKIHLTAISRSNRSQHVRLTQEMSLSWSSDALHGSVKNCCFMTLTLFDEHDVPFKFITSPVSLKMEETTYVNYDYDGENFLIHYQDQDLQVLMSLVSTEEHNTLVVVSLVLHLSVCSVNQHFDRHY